MATRDQNPSHTASGIAPYGLPPTGHRLPPGIRLGAVHLRISDLDRSLRYYLDILGLRLVDQSDGHAKLASGSDGSILIVLEERPGTSAAGQGRLGLYHFAILLPDRAHLGRFIKHLDAKGIRAGMADHLVSEAIYLRDPDGLGIEVYADRPRDSWAHRERELLMDTRPLDTADLIREGGNEMWMGMPEGTSLGHVHLHVGDLREASAFYHEALGLDLTVWSYPGALFLSAGGYHHHLGINTWQGPGAKPPGENEARLLDWSIILPGTTSVEVAVESLTEAGYATTKDRQFTVADPWGTRLRLETAPD